MINFTDYTTIKAIIIVLALLIIGAAISSPPGKKKIRKQVEEQRHKEMHPAPDRCLMRRRPEGGEIVLGKYYGDSVTGVGDLLKKVFRRLLRFKEYICWKISKDFHMLIVGGSGSGKSSTVIIPSLINNPDTPALVMDIKGELSRKSRRLDDERICIVNPIDRTSYGFDAFYVLKGFCTLQEVKEVAETIANTLVTVPADAGSDAYWYTSARSLLTAMLGYYILAQTENKRDFIARSTVFSGIPSESK